MFRRISMIIAMGLICLPIGGTGARYIPHSAVAASGVLQHPADFTRALCLMVSGAAAIVLLLVLLRRRLRAAQGV